MSAILIRLRRVPDGENASYHILVHGNAEGRGDLSCDSWTPQVGLRCFMSTMAAISSRLGPFGPGLFGIVDENSRRYFRVVSARWRRRSVEGFRTIATRTSRPGRMSSVHTPATTRSARRRLGERRRERLRIRSCCLMSTDSATTARAPARPNEPDEGRHEVQKQAGQVAHGTMLTS